MNMQTWNRIFKFSLVKNIFDLNFWNRKTYFPRRSRQIETVVKSWYNKLWLKLGIKKPFIFLTYTSIHCCIYEMKNSFTEVFGANHEKCHFQFTGITHTRSHFNWLSPKLDTHAHALNLSRNETFYALQGSRAIERVWNEKRQTFQRLLSSCRGQR